MCAGIFHARLGISIAISMLYGRPEPTPVIDAECVKRFDTGVVSPGNASIWSIATVQFPVAELPLQESEAPRMMTVCIGGVPAVCRGLSGEWAGHKLLQALNRTPGAVPLRRIQGRVAVPASHPFPPAPAGDSNRPVARPDGRRRRCSRHSADRVDFRADARRNTDRQ